MCSDTRDDGKIEETIEALRSVFPELQINHHYNTTLVVELHPRQPIRFVWKDGETGRARSSFESIHADGFEFHFGLPLTKTNFLLSSEFASTATLRAISERVRNMIEEAESEGYEELCAIPVCDYVVMEAPESMEAELVYNYLVETTDEKEYQSWQKMVENARLRHFHQSRFDCSICLERKDGIEGVLLDCDHSFCKDCFYNYVVASTKDDVTMLQCPNCPIEVLKNMQNMRKEELKAKLFRRKMSSRSLLEVISQDQVKKYEKLLTKLLFEKYLQFYPLGASLCPYCDTYLFRDDENDQMVVCHRCSFAHCFYCRRSWHGNYKECNSDMTIPQDIVDKLLDDTLSKTEMDRLKAKYGTAGIRMAKSVREQELIFKEAIEGDPSLVKCPGCEVVVTKSDGCNRMRCAMCFANFCYLCGSILSSDDPYGHYRDPRSWCYNRLFEKIEGDGLGMLRGAQQAGHQL